MPADSVLSVSTLSRSFGSVVANDDVNLSVGRGDVVGLLGHNGAGKTTLVNQIVGLLKPDSGSIHIGNIDCVAHPALARRHVAVQPQAQAPIDGLTPLLAIELAARIRGLSPRDARASAVRLIDELDLGPWRNQRALPEGGGLSGGIRRLTSFAMALAAPTPLVILDEPTNDVDAARRRLLWEAVRIRGDDGAGVLVVTHNVAEAERVVDELVILHLGKVVANGSPAFLRGAHDGDLRLELQVPTSSNFRHSEVPLPIHRHVVSGKRTLLTIPASHAAAAVSWAAQQCRTRSIESYSLTPATLEDAYLELTKEPINV